MSIMSNFEDAFSKVLGAKKEPSLEQRMQQLAEEAQKEPYGYQQYGLGYTVTVEEAQQMLAQKQAAVNSMYSNMQNQQQAYPYSMTSTVTNWSPNLGAQAANVPPRDPGFKPISQKTLESEAYNTPIPDLVNLWTLRYGSGWVKRGDVVDDEFFGVAAQRLLKLGRMEEFFLSDQQHTVLRVLE
jgi:hypothetical protein